VDHQQVLLIKTAWGGKTIDIDFRPPSSAKADPSHPVGPYYLWMVREVEDALSKLKADFPEYSSADGYEIAGFVWHQGWNDACGVGVIISLLSTHLLDSAPTPQASR
jgi:hypothetical protein